MTDALVLGGGIDALAAAATLARAGRSVTLLEERELLGGLDAPEELAPGLATCGERLTWAPPLELLDGLRLEDHGLAWRTDTPALLVADGEGAGLMLHAQAALMREELAPDQAEEHARWRERLERWGPALRAALLAPPPDLASRGLADLAGLARSAIGLRRLGERDLFELMRVAPSAAQDWLEDTHGDPILRAGLAVAALAGTTAGPRSPGTAATLLLDAVLRGPEPTGGPPALVDALSGACRSHGVELRTGARLERIRVEDGRALGVSLADGEELEADLVLSTLDLPRTALHLIDPANLPARLEAAARAWKCRGRTAVVHLALDTRPELPAADGRAVERVSTATDLRVMERAADAAKHGRLAAEPWAELRLIPRDAGAVVTLHLAGVPSDQPDREPVEAAARAIFERLSPGSDAHVVAARTRTPLDLEAQHRLTGGHLCQGELGLDQLWVQRPALALSRYTTPIDGLILGGACTHPGGGLPGGSGVLAARAAL